MTHIYDETGTLFAEYVYDAWGNYRIKTDIDGIGTLNPIRYRGYYYDTETGLYYLRARYYDPETGRFISQDDVSYLAPTHLSGLNLYAYCNDNPLKYIDNTGHFPWLLLGLFVLLMTPVGGVTTQAVISGVCWVGLHFAAIFDDDIKRDMETLGWTNVFNDDASVVIDSEKVSFYKGIPVFKTNIKDASASFGAIFYSRDHANWQAENVNILNHERGHNTQFMTMGLTKYLLFIAIPSPIKNGDYTPWELSASMLGGSGSANGSTTDQQKEAMLYYAFASTNNPLLWAYLIYQIIKTPK